MRLCPYICRVKWCQHDLSPPVTIAIFCCVFPYFNRCNVVTGGVSPSGFGTRAAVFLDPSRAKPLVCLSRFSAGNQRVFIFSEESKPV